MPSDFDTGPRDPSGPASVSATREAPIDLLCIVGSHRSGATVLAALLASPSGCFFVGELYRIPRPIWEPGDPARGCSCGRPVLECPFWSEVRRHALADPTFLPRLRSGRARFEPWSHLPTTLLRGKAGSPLVLDHAERMRTFLRMVAGQAGSQRLIESAYSPIRAWIYARGHPAQFRVRYLHLVRDGRDFLESEGRVVYDPESPWPWLRSAPVIIARWVVFNLAARLLLGWDSRRYLRIRYEDFLRDPEAGVERLARFTGWDLREVVENLRSGHAFPMKHVAAGNNARLLGSVKLRPPTVLPWQLSRARRLMFWGLAGWLALALGYQRSSRRATPILPDEEAPSPTTSRSRQKK